MDTKERHIRENESNEKREERTGREDLISESLPAEGREKKRHNTRKINNIWLWFGVMVLIAILLYWIFSIGLLGDSVNAFNG